MSKSQISHTVLILLTLLSILALVALEQNREYSDGGEFKLRVVVEDYEEMNDAQLVRVAPEQIELLVPPQQVPAEIQEKLCGIGGLNEEEYAFLNWQVEVTQDLALGQGWYYIGQQIGRQDYVQVFFRWDHERIDGELLVYSVRNGQIAQHIFLLSELGFRPEQLGEIYERHQENAELRVSMFLVSSASSKIQYLIDFDGNVLLPLTADQGINFGSPLTLENVRTEVSGLDDRGYYTYRFLTDSLLIINVNQGTPHNHSFIFNEGELVSHLPGVKIHAASIIGDSLVYSYELSQDERSVIRGIAKMNAYGVRILYEDRIIISEAGPGGMNGLGIDFYSRGNYVYINVRHSDDGESIYFYNPQNNELHGLTFTLEERRLSFGDLSLVQYGPDCEYEHMAIVTNNGERSLFGLPDDFFTRQQMPGSLILIPLAGTNWIPEPLYMQVSMPQLLPLTEAPFDIR